MTKRPPSPESLQLLKRRKEESSLYPAKDQWPEPFKELYTIHFRLNSYFTFLSSRKHVITTFDLLKEAPEKVIKRKLQVIDLARIKALIPDDVVFDYFDQNQFVLEEKHFTWKDGFKQKDNDIFELKDDDGKTKPFKQLLIFEFIDGDLTKSRTSTTFKTQMKAPQYSAGSIKKLIVQRGNKFTLAVGKFLNDCHQENVDPWTKLNELAESFVPHKFEFVDPIHEMEVGSSQIDSDENRPTMNQLVRRLKHARFYKGQIPSNGEFFLTPRSAQYSKLTFELSPMLKKALRDSKGIDKFYSHQAEAMNMIYEGKNVIVSTSTSSGKSLIYQVPVLDALEKDPCVTSMYIFPTKALAQDQKRSLRDLLNLMPGLSKLVVETYDGDAEKDHRQFVRSNASIIFTNPDMLHTSILPNHRYWQRFLRNLRYVVIDELHMYKALFGSHVALIMRRLRRICALFGNRNLLFISCSATLKDPSSHMHNIFGTPPEDIYHVSQDGSPSGGKHLIAWNPPLVDPGNPLSDRMNFISESARLVIELVKNNVRTIVFCVIRRTVELVMKEIRQLLKNQDQTGLLGQVMSYRGGYSAADRRKIEQQMFHGNLKAIISTNALELGIDIGSLDAVVMCGFPISIANFHQQSGRAGRRNKDSLTLLVAADDPVSQHYMSHPDELIKTEYPDLAIDFENVLVLEGHLQCAAYEIPLAKDLKLEEPFFCDYKKLEEVVERRLILDASDNRYHCNPRYLPWPSAKVSIRAVEEDRFAVVDVTNGRNVVIEEIEASRTTYTLYDGGIFIHQGLPYLIRDFDPDERYAKVERVNVDWTTSQRDFTNVDPLEIEKIRSINTSDVPIYFGTVETTMVVFGYFKLDRRNQILDAVEVHNPPVKYKSKGLWIDVPEKALEYIHSKSLNAPGGIHAAQHAIINMLPLFILSGLNEIQTECKAPEKEFAHRETKRKRPARLIIFDSKGGQFGSGLSTKAFDNIDIILEQALKTLLECDCEWGCPKCCAAANCKENSLVLSKYAAIIIIAVILGRTIDLDSFPDGPEPNMPEVSIETIRPANEFGMVKYAPDLEIIDFKSASQPLQPLPKEEEVVYVDREERRARKELEEETEKRNEDGEILVKQEPK
ncbi:DEKNAAC103638 [Brettanomyces naardenensis]|uniref:DEKNAAC103638 n=1 Tax=Brettanomyces naardenensis TaxID=13370 RepID=A0A448YNE3_BRENA|nr:DEKNAAC103638 [Brettanomyces naardenensis]